MINKDYIYPPEDYLYDPRRGPIDLILSIKDLIINNTCCEIGCASGYLLNFVKENLNKNIIGIEYRKNAVEYCLKYNYNVSLCDATTDVIPECNLYYGWFGNYDTEKKIINNLIKLYNSKILIIFFSNSVDIEVESYNLHIDNLKKNNIKYETFLCNPIKEPHKHYLKGILGLKIFIN